MAKRGEEPAKILGRNRLFIDEHKSCVITPGFSPAFEQRADGFLVVGNKSKTFF